MSRYYPAFLDLAGRRCVVIGAGKLAEEKARDLRDTGAEVVTVGAYSSGDLAGAFLAVDASGDPAVNAAVRSEATREKVLLNAVDVPPLCDFIAPAVVRRDPLQIAVSTGGESPFLAAALRARLERLIPADWGPFTALVGSIRRRLRAADVPLSEQTAEYRRLLRGRTGPAVSGRVALVGAGPGDPGLLTLRAAELLAGADHVLHDALVPSDVLAFAGPQAELIDVGKRSGRARMSQERINSLLIELARAGGEVVRLKGGDPFVFGRGGEELAALTAAGVEVLVVPGVTSAVAAPALAGIPLTLRGAASSVAFLTGHDPARLAAAALAADTLVVLMALERLEEICAGLQAVLGAGHPAALVSEASRDGQRSVRSTLAGLPAAVHRAGLAAPATLVVGAVVSASARVGNDEAGTPPPGAALPLRPPSRARYQAAAPTLEREPARPSAL